jgi:preprotein translocase subunit YajC
LKLINADIIAMTLMVLAPLIMMVGMIAFIYRHREQWRREMRELRDDE